MSNAQSYRPDQLEEISKKKENVVLVEKHDLQFEPWPSTRLKKCIDSIIEITYDPNLNLDVEAIRKKCKEKLELLKFSNYHHTMFERLTDPKYAHDARFTDGIKMMIETKERMEVGQVESQEDADKEVVGKLLKKYHTMNLH
tara:strand:- start:293 stop:718 length:426 start_codon:yes stop_codon:yes gene_type:complete